MKLFIIGNGFDLAHGLHTRYSDFQKYLEKINPEILTSDMPYPEVFIKNGELRCSRESSANLIWHLLNRVEQKNDLEREYITWSQTEKALGELDYTECFDEYFGKWNTQKGKLEPQWKFALQNEFVAIKLATAVLSVTDFVKEWINQIDLNAIEKESFRRYIDKDSIFISFNYTDILQKIYNIKEVIHIHGKKDSTEIIFGHGNSNNIEKEYDDVLWGSRFALNNIHIGLKKDVDSIIKYFEQNKFWGRLDNITEVYTYGFSYNEIDLPYIRKIIKSTSKCQKWFIEDFPKKDLIDCYIKRIRLNGYYNDIETFHVEE